MKRARKNIDEIGAYSDLLLYAIILTFAAFFVLFHALCAFVVTGFVTGGFAGEWSSVLRSYMTDWNFARWSIGIPLVLFCMRYYSVMRAGKRNGPANIFQRVAAIEGYHHPGCTVHEIVELNGDAYLDRLYEETLIMCRNADVKMPKLFYVSTAGLNAYTTTAEDGTHGIVLLAELMDAISFGDVKAVVAHEIGHIISHDVAYGKFIGYAIQVMTACWIHGQFLAKIKSEQLMHPPGGRDASPVEWLAGLGAIVLGYVMIVLGGFTNYCGMAIRWLRDRQAEFLADSRGATLLDDEQEFADMIIMLHCASAMRSPTRSFQLNVQANLRSLTFPGEEFGNLDVHPDDIDRVRRIRPSFDGNFKRAYAEIVSKRRKTRP